MSEVVILAVRLQPGAATDRIDGWEVDGEGRPVLRLRLRARAVEGQANAALIRFMAEVVGLPKAAVVLTRGDRSRLKRLSLHGLDAARIHARIEARCPDAETL